jgi:chemotaxis protein histidine kinase CheA
VKRVLVIGRDVTEQREAEKAEREAKEIQDLVGSVLRDKAAFTAAVNEARELLRAIASVEDSDTMRRALHTLKGNMAMFGPGTRGRGAFRCAGALSRARRFMSRARECARRVFQSPNRVAGRDPSR